jgi:hypothetical protein
MGVNLMVIAGRGFLVILFGFCGPLGISARMMLASSWVSEAGMVVRAANIVAVPVAARKAATEVHQ